MAPGRHLGEGTGGSVQVGLVLALLGTLVWLGAGAGDEFGGGGIERDRVWTW